MEIQRLLLFAALAFTVMMMWSAWQKDYGPKPPVTQSQAQTSGSTAANQATLEATVPGAPGSAAGESSPGEKALTSTGRIRVHTDVYDIDIDTTGGDLREVDLLKYPVAANEPKTPFRLMHDSGEGLFVAQTGLLPAANGPKLDVPNHHSIFQSAKSEYTLAKGQDTLNVRLVWKGSDGVEIDKIYTFHRGRYVVDVAYEVHNGSSEPWQGHIYRQLQRTRPKSKKRNFVHTFTGGVIHTPEKPYQKISLDDMEKKDLSTDISDGWLAMTQHYFLAAWVPNSTVTGHYYTKNPGKDRFIIGMVGPDHQVAPGTTSTITSRLFVGPKLQDHLGEVAPGLELTVDYGWLTFIAEPIFWVLKHIHNIIGNWGWSIILVTILIKAMFYKLSETSYKSMAHMRKMQPRMQNLKERFGDDKEKLNEAMMKMYKEEKINPLGGCLPIVVQIPVFISLYWVLLESVEMRQADFMFWLNDLSSADPYFVLPLIMGVTMLIQQRLNPTPMDPIQAKVMMVLPVVFTVFFAFFPAGLVLYWVVNNTLSIAQQYYITRYVVKA